MMAGSSDTFSSALSSRRYTKEILCSYGYRQDLARAFATKLSHFVIEYKKVKRGSTLAKTNYFMSHQICRIGDGLWFCLIHTLYVLYWKLVLVITCQYHAILRLRSNTCLELACIHYSADIRLSFSSHLPIGEPGKEAIRVAPLYCQVILHSVIMISKSIDHKKRQTCKNSFNSTIYDFN